MASLGPRDAAAWRRERIPHPFASPPPRPPRPLATLLALRAWRALRRRNA